MNDPLDRFSRAVKLGPDALLRLRAEILIGYADSGRISITDQDRETLERISAFPGPDDREFLSGFDDAIIATMDPEDEA